MVDVSSYDIEFPICTRHTRNVLFSMIYCLDRTDGPSLIHYREGLSCPRARASLLILRKLYHKLKPRGKWCFSTRDHSLSLYWSTSFHVLLSHVAISALLPSSWWAGGASEPSDRRLLLEVLSTGVVLYEVFY